MSWRISLKNIPSNYNKTLIMFAFNIFVNREIVDSKKNN